MRPVIGLTTSLILPEGSMPAERFGVTAHYCRAVAAAGGAPLLIPSPGDPEMARPIFDLLDGLLFTGGPDIDPAHYGEPIHPGCERIDANRDTTELALLGWVREGGLPTLGICRGLQLINVGFGGTLYQDIPTERPTPLDHRASVPQPSHPSHTLRVAQSSRLMSVLGAASIPANSLHHQAIDSLAPGFLATAHSEDGVIEAIESSDLPFVVAVQCHPEHLYEADGLWLRPFQALVEQATARSRRHQAVHA